MPVSINPGATALTVMARLANSTASALAAPIRPAFAAEWLTDLEAAKKQAAAENKAILVDFTGSDWCGYCIRLKKNVFDKPEFADYAKDKFVLLEIDVPNNPKFDRELLKKNRQLCSDFNVSGFPTILVLTPQGEVAGGFVGGKPDLNAVQAALDPALENVAALAAAEKLTGDEKTKALAACYEALPDSVKESAKSLRGKIVANDPNDLSGLKAEVEAEKQLAEIEAKLIAAGNDMKKVLATLEALMPEVLPANKPIMLNSLFELRMLTSENEQDLEKAKQTLDELAALLPDQKADIEALKARISADPAALLEKIKKQREFMQRQMKPTE